MTITELRDDLAETIAAKFDPTIWQISSGLPDRVATPMILVLPAVDPYIEPAETFLGFRIHFRVAALVQTGNQIQGLEQLESAIETVAKTLLTDKVFSMGSVPSPGTWTINNQEYSVVTIPAWADYEF